MDDSTPILHAEVVQAVSKVDKPYECIEISLGEISVGRVFPSPLEMTTIKRTLGLA